MLADDVTRANYRYCRVVRDELASFVSWLRQRDDFTPAEKDKLARLAAEYQREAVGTWGQ